MLDRHFDCVCSSQKCLSEAAYMGPSEVGTCTMAYMDSSCVSRGPDMVVGAIAMTLDRMVRSSLLHPAAWRNSTRADNR